MGPAVSGLMEELQGQLGGNVLCCFACSCALLTLRRQLSAEDFTYNYETFTRFLQGGMEIWVRCCFALVLTATSANSNADAQSMPPCRWKTQWIRVCDSPFTGIKRSALTNLSCISHKFVRYRIMSVFTLSAI